MREIKERLASFWPHDESPGYTEYPEADIKAHRANAVQSRRFGLVLFIGAIIATSVTGDGNYFIAGVALAALCMWASASFRVQALEWEVQLERDNE